MTDKYKEDSIPKTIARYSSSKFYRHITRAVNAFIRPKLLEPELYGFWNLIGLLLFYSSYSHLGSRDTIRYLVPYYNGKGEYDKSLQIKGSVFYGSFYINIIISFALIVYTLTGHMETTVRLGLLTLSALSIINWYSDFYSVHIQSNQNFRLLTSKNYLESTVSLLLSAILLYFFNIYGLYLSITVSGIIVIIYLRVNYSLETHYRFNFHIFLDSIKRGFPIIIFSFSFVLIRTADRIIISSFLGNKMLGFYGIAVALFDFIMQIPGSSREVLEPKLMQSLSKYTVEENLTNYFFKPLYNTAYLIPLLIGPIFFVLPPFIHLLLPKYIPGILSAQIIVFGVYFFGLTYITRGIIVANGWQLKLLNIDFPILLLNAIMSIILIKKGFGIQGVAVSSNISYFILFISVMVFILKKHNYKAKEGITTILSLFWPFPIMCGTIILLNNITKIIQLNAYLASALNILFYCIIMLFVFNYAKKRYPFLRDLNLKEII